MNKTILIIDDDQILRDALAKGLRDEGFNVITAPSAESGANILKRIYPDIIVLDRMMTGMDGLTFLQQLRQSGNITPVIMLTAMSGADNAIAGLSGGANDYLAKPFQIRELVLRIRNIIKLHGTHISRMPQGLSYIDNEFFITDNTKPDAPARILSLSGEEKKLLLNLVNPIGNIVPAAPMVAKRLRGKINIVLSHLDILTIRGRGYKLIDMSTQPNNTDGK